VVDDGSTDKTASIAQKWQGSMEVVLLRHAQNSGLGAALGTGITWCISQPGDAADALAVMDADGTHPPELLGELVRCMFAPGHELDVVIASRYAPGGEEHGLPALRRLYSRVASVTLGALARVRGARDYTCGYRLYRKSILLQARERYGEELVTERSFVCMAELLIKLARCGARVGEVPLKLHYELKGGASKMRVAATIRRYVLLGWRLLFDPRYR
jgi:dolichol-phosphate mannosyltransferase